MLDYTNELIQAVQEVFQTMIFIDVQFLADAGDPIWPPEKQFTAMIGLGGEESGLIYFHCDESFAFRSTNAMLGMDVGDDKASVVDAMGEVANMIGGSFKNKVKAFENYRLSLPSVIYGKDYKTHTPQGHEKRDLWFDSDGQKILAQLILKK